jgi:hypothetical protein
MGQKSPNMNAVKSNLEPNLLHHQFNFNSADVHQPVLTNNNAYANMENVSIVYANGQASFHERINSSASSNMSAIKVDMAHLGSNSNSTSVQSIVRNNNDDSFHAKEHGILNDDVGDIDDNFNATSNDGMMNSKPDESIDTANSASMSSSRSKKLLERLAHWTADMKRRLILSPLTPSNVHYCSTSASSSVHVNLPSSLPSPSSSTSSSSSSSTSSSSSSLSSSSSSSVASEHEQQLLLHHANHDRRPSDSFISNARAVATSMPRQTASSPLHAFVPDTQTHTALLSQEQLVQRTHQYRLSLQNQLANIKRNFDSIQNTESNILCKLSGIPFVSSSTSSSAATPSHSTSSRVPSQIDVGINNPFIESILDLRNQQGHHQEYQTKPDANAVVVRLNPNQTPIQNQTQNQMPLNMNQMPLNKNQMPLNKNQMPLNQTQTQTQTQIQHPMHAHATLSAQHSMLGVQGKPSNQQVSTAIKVDATSSLHESSQPNIHESDWRWSLFQNTEARRLPTCTYTSSCFRTGKVGTLI